MGGSNEEEMIASFVDKGMVSAITLADGKGVNLNGS